MHEPPEVSFACDRVDAIPGERRRLDTGHDLPERLGLFVCKPRAELTLGIFAVDVKDWSAHADAAVNQQKVIADELGLGGNATDGIDDLAEQACIGSKEHISIVPDVVAVLAGDSAAEAGPCAEQIDRSARAVDPPVKDRSGQASLKLMAE